MSASRTLSFTIFLLVVIPVIFLAFSFREAQGENWSHLLQYLFPEMLKETLLLVLGVVVGTSLIATPLAYMHSFYSYPAKKILDAFFILPLAFPIYVYAAIGLSLFGLTGEVTLWLATKFGLSPFTIDIKNLLGLIQIFSFALYPYLYVALKEAFHIHGQQSFEVGGNLGLNRIKVISAILLPVSRPWFMAGIVLVIMETIADFGATSMFNVTTFTTGIYRAWFGMFSLPTAAQIASTLVTVVLILYLIYKFFEYKKHYAMAAKPKKIKEIPIKGIKLLLFYLVISIFLFATLFLPIIFLLKNSYRVLLTNFHGVWESLQGPILNTLFLALLGSTIIVLISLSMSYFSRFKLKRYELVWFEISKMGYAIPGTILAVAIYVPLTHVDQFLFHKNVMTLSLIPLFLGYLIRFLPIALNPLEATFKKIGDTHIAILNNLGIKNVLRWKKIFLPLSFATISSSFFLVFLEVMKELPITLMTRPFGHDTLAVKIFEYTSEGDWDRASLPSLFLVTLGVLAIQIMASQINNNKKQ
ncbi:MAG: iron ABC transporter permease [Bacteriovoracaceae bacterium]|nr:iron ABC transporter permease [Bacteriovoracaceae bacterium]